MCGRVSVCTHACLFTPHKRSSEKPRLRLFRYAKRSAAPFVINALQLSLRLHFPTRVPIRLGQHFLQIRLKYFYFTNNPKSVRPPSRNHSVILNLFLKTHWPQERKTTVRFDWLVQIIVVCRQVYTEQTGKEKSPPCFVNSICRSALEGGVQLQVPRSQFVSTFAESFNLHLDTVSKAHITEESIKSFPKRPMPVLGKSVKTNG